MRARLQGAAPSARERHRPSSEPPPDLPDLGALLRHALPHAGDRSRRVLVAEARLERFTTGAVPYRQSEGRPFAIIVTGHAALRRTTIAGRELVPRLAGSGRIIGISGIVGRMASNDVVALTPLVLATWRPSFVRSLAEGDAGLGLDLLEQTIAMSRELWEQLDALIYQNARGRVARVLAAHDDLLFGTPPEITRGQLSGLVGTSREMTRRVLRSLEADAVVQRVGITGLRLLDRRALERIAAQP